MNNLNSVLIEGIVTPAIVAADTALKLAVFEIANIRFIKNQETGETIKEVSNFEIVTYNRLAEICIESIPEIHGKHVRVVGRMRQDGDKIRIVADHIEFKPTGRD